MIMQSLVALYETLAEQGKVPHDGWEITSVGGEIYLKPDGTLEQIANLRTDQGKGKGKPQEIPLPSWGDTSTNAVRADFLSGISAFVLGMSKRESGTDKRIAQSVEAAWQLHHEILDGVKHPAVEALLLYFDRLKAGERIDARQVSALPRTALTNDRFVFSLNGQRLNEIPELMAAWDGFYQKLDDVCVEARCLVTGKIGPIARKHPMIKVLYGANGNGAGLSNFNFDSVSTFGYDQNLNAPVCRHAAYAYTQAIIYLLTHQNYFQTLGKTLTIVWWPDNANEDYAELAGRCAGVTSKSSKWKDEDVALMLSSLSKGKPVNNIEPDCKFYVMGLTPNEGRISVRFFWHDTFGALLKNVVSHYDRLELTGNIDERKLTPFRAFCAMTRDDIVSAQDVIKALPEPVIQGYFESVLFGAPYPVQMLSLTHRRLQVTHPKTKEEDIDSGNTRKTKAKGRAKAKKKADKSKGPMWWHRTSLIKAYFLQTLPDSDKRKECFAVSLLENNTTPGYVLGRLFAVYEAAQNVGREKKPWEEAPIHPMFAAAMTTPAAVYPRLARTLSIYLPKDECVRYAKLVEEIKWLLPGEYPKRLDMVDQGAFDLGYYHQRQVLFAGKDDESTDDGAESED